MYSLAFEPAAATSASLSAYWCMSENGRGEEATDAADATAFCTAAASTRNKTLAATKTTLPFLGEVVVAIVVATACCTWIATSTESNLN